MLEWAKKHTHTNHFIRTFLWSSGYSDCVKLWSKNPQKTNKNFPRSTQQMIVTSRVYVRCASNNHTLTFLSHIKAGNGFQLSSNGHPCYRECASVHSALTVKSSVLFAIDTIHEDSNAHYRPYILQIYSHNQTNNTGELKTVVFGKICWEVVVTEEKVII